MPSFDKFRKVKKVGLEIPTTKPTMKHEWHFLMQMCGTTSDFDLLAIVGAQRIEWHQEFSLIAVQKKAEESNINV